MLCIGSSMQESDSAVQIFTLTNAQFSHGQGRLLILGLAGGYLTAKENASWETLFLKGGATWKG